jgi:hypothetical protein
MNNIEKEPRVYQDDRSQWLDKKPVALKATKITKNEASRTRNQVCLPTAGAKI